MPRTRNRLNKDVMYSPQWDGPIEGYVVNYLRINFWRVSTMMEYEDAMQEAKLVFLKLRQRYGDLDSGKHFMALFKTSWENHFVDLSHASTSAKKEVLSSQCTDDEGEEIDSLISGLAGDMDNHGMLSIMIQQAPQEIRSVLHLFFNAPVELLDQFSNVWKSSGRKKDYGNAMLCKALGISESVNIVAAVECYFLHK